MANPVEVTDSLSNADEQIERAAKTIGRGVRRNVFEAIYYHKSRVKTVQQVAERAGLTRKQVLNEARKLVLKHIVLDAKLNGEKAYEMVSFFQAHKNQILRLTRDKAALERLPTKRKVTRTLSRTVKIPANGAHVEHVTIDDIKSFSRVKAIPPGDGLPATMSEETFKKGVQRLLGEPGEFKDWAGERSDLYSTRLRIRSRRIRVAFGFKGPGVKGKLVPGRMGNRGDQAPKLFHEEADAYFVQHWREIDSSVIDLLRRLAIAKSATSGRRIYYGIIDGVDSQRLVTAYPGYFKAGRRLKGARKR